MHSGTRTPTMPAALLTYQGKRTRSKSVNFRVFVDPWRTVCGRCPLADCALPEGGVHGQRGIYIEQAIQQCPAERAKAAGWTPEQALTGWQELGLLEEEYGADS